MSEQDLKNAAQLQELTSVRSELNSTIDRMNANENFAAGAVSALFAFIFSGQISAMTIAVSVFPVLIVVFGYVRFRELRVHMNELDEYLISLETSLSPTGGWSTHFAKNILPQRIVRYSSTRDLFWAGLFGISISGAAFVALNAYIT